MSQTYTERVIAFVDILGFQNIVSKSENNDDQLSLILESLEFLKGFEISDKWNTQYIEIEESAQKKGLERFRVKDDVQCTCFSDSITVSVPVSNQSVNEVASTLIANLAYIGARLLTEGVLIRGGITVGNLIHKSNGIIFGQALIDAYKLENSSAIYPRIIISDKLIERLNYPIYKNCDSYSYHQYLSRFEDGYVGFSQLIFFQVVQSYYLNKEQIKVHKEQIKAELGKSRKTIIDGLNCSAERSDVFVKFQWLKDQYEKLVILESGLKECIKPIMENTIHYPT